VIGEDHRRRLATLTGPDRPVPWPLLVIVGATLLAVAAVVPVSPVAAVALAAVVAIILNPALGLAVLVFLTWSRLSDALISSVGAPSVAQPYVIFLLLVMIGRWFLLGEEPARWRQPAMLLFAYTLLGIGSLLYADGYDAALLEFTEFGKAALIFALALSLVSSPERLRLAVWALLAAGGLLGAMTVLQYVTGTFDNTYWGLARSEVQHIVGQVSDRRASGPAVGPNGYAQIMLVLVPLAIERMLRDPWRWARPVAGVVAFLATAAVILTFSRQGPHRSGGHDGGHGCAHPDRSEETAGAGRAGRGAGDLAGSRRLPRTAGHPRRPLPHRRHSDHRRRLVPRASQRVHRRRADVRRQPDRGRGTRQLQPPLPGVRPPAGPREPPDGPFPSQPLPGVRVRAGHPRTGVVRHSQRRSLQGNGSGEATGDGPGRRFDGKPHHGLPDCADRLPGHQHFPPHGLPAVLLAALCPRSRHTVGGGKAGRTESQGVPPPGVGAAA
jgi:hypothetical protein